MPLMNTFTKRVWLPPDGVMVINLNLRSVTALDDNGDSLLRKQVKALTDKNFGTNVWDVR